MNETTSHPYITDQSIAHLEDELEVLRKLMNSPTMTMMRDPNARQWVFPYEGDDLVIIGRSQTALASVVRAMRVGRTSRSGRRGSRQWHIEALPLEQMPRRAVAVKPSRRRGN